MVLAAFLFSQYLEKYDMVVEELEVFSRAHKALDIKIPQKFSGK